MRRLRVLLSFLVTTSIVASQIPQSPLNIGESFFDVESASAEVTHTNHGVQLPCPFGPNGAPVVVSDSNQIAHLFNTNHVIFEFFPHIPQINIYNRSACHLDNKILFQFFKIHVPQGHPDRYNVAAGGQTLQHQEGPHGIAPGHLLTVRAPERAPCAMQIDFVVLGSNPVFARGLEENRTDNGTAHIPPCPGVPQSPQPAGVCTAAQVKAFIQQGVIIANYQQRSASVTFQNNANCRFSVSILTAEILPDNTTGRVFVIQPVQIPAGGNGTVTGILPTCNFQVDYFYGDFAPRFLANTAAVSLEEWNAHILAGFIVGDAGVCPFPETTVDADLTGPTSVTPGQKVSFTLTLRNTGQFTAANPFVRDHVGLSNTTYVASESTPTCTDRGIANGARIVQCEPGNIPVNGTQQFTVVYQIPANAQCGSTINRTINADAQNAPPSAVKSFPLQVVCAASSSSAVSSAVSSVASSAAPQQVDLSVRKQGPSTVSPGGTITYNLVTRTDGPGTSYDAIITDQIPSGLEFAGSNFPNNCNQQGSQIVCTFLNNNNVPPGSEGTITLTFRVPAGQACGSTISNTATIQGPRTTDQNTGNNQGTATTTVVCAASSSSAVSSAAFSSVASSVASSVGFSSSSVAVSSAPSGADLFITKSGPSTAQGGGTIAYTVTGTNAGPGVATNITIADVIPGGLQFVQSQSAGCVLNSAGTSVLCNNFNLNSGESRTFTITFQLPTQCVNTTIQNTATISTSATDPNSSNNVSQIVSTQVSCPTASSSAAFSSVASSVASSVGFSSSSAAFSSSVSSAPQNADLSISKSGPSSVTRGNSVSYTVTVQNNGPARADNVVVRDSLPDGTAFLSGSSSAECQLRNPGDDGDNDGRARVRCDIGSLESGQSKQLTIVFLTLPSNQCTPSEIRNVARVRSATNDQNDGNNRSNAVVTQVNCPAGASSSAAFSSAGFSSSAASSVGFSSSASSVSSAPFGADLSITKSGPSSVTRGGTIAYTLTATNAGPATATNIVIADVIPGGLQFVQSQSAGCVLNSAGTSVLCNNFQLASGESRTFTVTFTVPLGSQCSPTTIQNTATISTSATDPNSSNNMSQIVSTQVSCPAGASSSAAFSSSAFSSASSQSPLVGCIRIEKETFDTNGNVLRPVAQFTFRLDNGRTTQNTANGNARFDNVPVGMHMVTEDVPSNWTQLSVAPAGGVVEVFAGRCSAVVFKNKQVIGGQTPPSFAISKTDNRTSARPGDELRYEVTIRNNGSTNASSETVTDTLPQDVQFMSASDGGSFNANDRTITWNNIFVPASGTRTLVVVAKVKEGTPNGRTLTNTATIRGMTAQDTTTVDAVPAGMLRIHKHANTNEGRAGQRVAYAIVVQNTANVPLHNVVVEDVFDGSKVSIIDAGGGSVQGNTIRWNLGTLQPGQSRTLFTKVRFGRHLKKGDVVRNTATVRGDSAQPATSVSEIKITWELPWWDVQSGGNQNANVNAQSNTNVNADIDVNAINQNTIEQNADGGQANQNASIDGNANADANVNINANSGNNVEINQNQGQGHSSSLWGLKTGLGGRALEWFR